jgi:hypothetical protein
MASDDFIAYLLEEPSATPSSGRVRKRRPSWAQSESYSSSDDTEEEEQNARDPKCFGEGRTEGMTATEAAIPRQVQALAHYLAQMAAEVALPIAGDDERGRAVMVSRTLNGRLVPPPAMVGIDPRKNAVEGLEGGEEVSFSKEMPFDEATAKWIQDTAGEYEISTAPLESVFEAFGEWASGDAVAMRDVVDAILAMRERGGPHAILVIVDVGLPSFIKDAFVTVEGGRRPGVQALKKAMRFVEETWDYGIPARSMWPELLADHCASTPCTIKASTKDYPESNVLYTINLDRVTDKNEQAVFDAIFSTTGTQAREADVLRRSDLEEVDIAANGMVGLREVAALSSMVPTQETGLLSVFVVDSDEAGPLAKPVRDFVRL